MQTRELPEGFQLDWDKAIWNVGHVYIWSPVFEGWLRSGIITVRPNDTLAEAYERVYDAPLPKHTEIFFVEGV